MGRLVHYFDLLIGATVFHHGHARVTNNTKHFQRLNGIKLEDWCRGWGGWLSKAFRLGDVLRLRHHTDHLHHVPQGEVELLG